MSGIDNCTTCETAPEPSKGDPKPLSAPQPASKSNTTQPYDVGLAGPSSKSSTTTNESVAKALALSNGSTPLPINNLDVREKFSASDTGSTGGLTRPSDSIEKNQSNVEEMVPPPAVYPSLVIEFCDRCRWAPRATWIQTELFLTFPTPVIRSITLLPLNSPETGGRFRVWVDKGEGQQLVWDRKTEGGFPELKVLKQRLRNIIQPEKDLGHSDNHQKTSGAVASHQQQIHNAESSSSEGPSWSKE